MHVFTTIANFRLLDILDICLLTVLVYHLFLWFRGTKAVKALIGLLGLVIVYLVGQSLGFFLTTLVFQVLFQVAVILLIVLFQSEIREVLERVNPLQIFGFRKQTSQEKWIEPFADGIFALAEKKIGALAVIERLDGVSELMAEGQALIGEPSPEILMTVFQKESPLHDGALLIRNGQITKAACYLPLSTRKGLPRKWGTRHRAALGLSENTDAWVIVVSEERGRVSVAHDNEVISVNSPERLSQMISEAIAPDVPDRGGLPERLLSLFHERWQYKGGALLMVVILWFTMAGQQEFETTVTIPLGLKNMPPEYEIVEPISPRVEIAVRGLRRDAGAMDEDSVMVEIDMDLVRLGRRTFSIRRDDVRLANDRINVVSIEPAKLKFNLREKTADSSPEEPASGQ